MKLHRFLLLFILLSHSSLAQSVFLTEIFADPTPSRGLPEIEFLEIYNSSEHDISLKGWSLMYGSTASVFPDSVIKSGQIAILVRSPFVNDLKPYGYVIGLPSLTLNNNGAVLRLLNPQKEEVHYVSYSSDWYTQGRNDGYSLEMIDTDFPCVGKTNWASSSSETGATPGKENTAKAKNPDNSPPKLLQYSLVEKTITLIFDEIVNRNFGENIENFEILKGNNEILSVTFQENRRDALILTLDSELQNELELIIYDSEDCSANVGQDIRILFIDLPEPSSGDIQISEILFNPKTGGEDFVEIYNTTEQPFNLKDWKFAHFNNQGVMASIRNISAFDLIISPKTHLAFTTNKPFLVANYAKSGTSQEENIIAIPSLPAYNNDAGTVLLLKPDSTVFDRFTYSEKMHASLINNPDGVSLEKVSFRKNQNKWTSASSDAGYATPGSPNSQAENEFLDQEFLTEPTVFNPYQNSDKSSTFLTYKLSHDGNYASITVLDKNGKKVRSLGQNLLLGTTGKIQWDGTDDYGSLLPVGYYVFSINVFGNDFNKQFYAKTVIGSY
jgi:hypothetical protein